MPVPLFKSLLAIVILFVPFVQLYTMLEAFARPEKRFSESKLLRIHRIDGYFYIAISLVITYLCVRFTWSTGTELTARSALHSMFAIAIMGLLIVKIAVVRVYRGWLPRVPVFGLSIAVLTFLLVASSAGYYFVVTHFTKELSAGRGVERVVATADGKEISVPKIEVKSDPQAIESGKKLFERNCTYCHTVTSTKTIVGPGLQGILTRGTLPVSGRPALPENIFRQLRQPFKNMPSFAEKLTDGEVLDLIAFLNTQ